MAFLNPKFLGFLFYEKYHNLGSEMRKIKLQKIVGNLLDKFRKLYMNGTVIKKFVAVLKQKKILDNICFFSRCVPLLIEYKSQDEIT